MKRGYCRDDCAQLDMFSFIATIVCDYCKHSEKDNPIIYIIKLVEKYEKHSCLYDFKLPDYSKRNVTD